MTINSGAAATFWNSMGVTLQTGFGAEFLPSLDPIGDAQNWVNTNIAAMNALGITTYQSMSNAQQNALFQNPPVVPTQTPTQSNAAGGNTGIVGTLGHALGLNLPGFSGGARHFVMRAVEVVVGVVLVGAAVKSLE